ncbi:MAG: ATP synthase F0 subunit C [Armatimonadota bacterium]
MFYLGMLALAVGLGLPIAVLSAAAGQGRIGAAAMEAMARQPDAAGPIRTGMLIALAFVESLVIYALVIFVLLQGRLPQVAEILNKIK